MQQCTLTYTNTPRRALLQEHTGAGMGDSFTINIPLPPGSGSGAYAYAIETIVVPSIKRFRPELIM
ncbi:hypothetical protein SARC_13368, partial [Sphaeroforma arctica JP610]